MRGAARDHGPHRDAGPREQRAAQPPRHRGLAREAVHELERQHRQHDRAERARQQARRADHRIAGERVDAAPHRHQRIGRGEQAEQHVVATVRGRADHEPGVRRADRGDQQRDEASDDHASSFGDRKPYSSILRSSVGRLISRIAHARRLFHSVLASTLMMWRRSSSRSVESSPSSPAGAAAAAPVGRAAAASRRARRSSRARPRGSACSRARARCRATRTTSASRARSA